MYNKREAVSKGAALMDRTHPGWHRRINKDTLDMANSCECVGGQEEGAYTYFLEAVGLKDGREHGFSLQQNDLRFNAYLEWKELGEMWIEEIDLRLLRDEMEEASDIGVKTEEELAVA